MEAGVFFQRVEWVPSFAPPGATPGVRTSSEAAAEFTRFAASLGMSARVLTSAKRARLAWTNGSIGPIFNWPCAGSASKPNVPAR